MGILDGQKGGDEASLKIEADLVVSAVIVGFLHEECLCDRDVIIGYDAAKDTNTHRPILTKLRKILSQWGGRKHIRFVAFPRYAGNASFGTTRNVAITGSPYGQQHVEMSAGAMELARQLQANTQGHITGLLKNVEVDERGAYYGIIDHPTQTRIISTTRRLIRYENSGEGRRWNRGVEAHGMIGAQMVNREQNGDPWTFGSMIALTTPFEKRCASGRWPAEDEGVVGYCHGMNWAIMHCDMLGGGIPYEIAVGTATTKLASCFGCTTFMYASGFPPSFIHLGRAESWVPPPFNKTDNLDGEVGCRSARRLHGMWAEKVADWLRLGASDIQDYVVRGDYSSAMNKLHSAVNHRARLPSAETANLFLDALTVHDSDYKRLSRVFGI